MIQLANATEAQTVTKRLQLLTWKEESGKKVRNTMSAIKPNELTDWLTGISIVLSATSRVKSSQLQSVLAAGPFKSPFQKFIF